LYICNDIIFRFTINNIKMQFKEEIDTTNCLLVAHLQKAKNAYNWVSHSPDRRGATCIKEYSDELAADLEFVAQHGGDVANYREKYERQFLTWLSAQGNCFSVMITGGSGFNNTKHAKANAREKKAYDNFREWREKVHKAIKAAERREERKATTPLEEAMANAEMERKTLETMKAANKIIKSKSADKLAELVAVGIKASAAEELLKPDYMGRHGFASFSLTNCRNRMKNWEEKAEALKKNQVKEANEIEVAGVRIVQNYQDNRIELYFDGKPSDKIRAELKSNGFRWTPSKECWQSYNNNNTIYKLQKFVLPAIKAA